MENLSFDITAELKGLNKTLDKASSNIEGFAKKNEARFKAFGESTKKLGKQLSMSLTAPLALLAGNSVRIFADFDDQMRKVGATSGATETELKQLTDTAKQLGQTTRFSAREAGKGLEYMALAGYDTEQSISAIPDVLNLAAAAGIELGASADIVTDTMSALGIEAEKAGLVSDVFAKTQARANTSVLQLGEAFKLSASNANSFGADLETASAILGKFADSGIKGSQAGTTFNGILRDLKGAAEDGAVAINGQNVALADNEGNFRDILDIMQDVEEATKDLTEMQKSQALEAIFQQQSIRGVNILMQQGVGASKDLREELYKAGGTAKQMAEQMEGGLGGAMRNLNSAFEGFSIEIGQVLAPLVNKLAGFLGKLLNYFNELSPTTKKIIVAIGGLVAVAGPLLVALGGLMTILPAILSGLAVLTGPIGLIVLAIGALTAVVIANWDTIKKWANDIANYFIGLYNESIVFRSGIEYVIFYVKSFFEIAKFVFNSLWTLIKAVVGNIVARFTLLGDILKNLFSPKGLAQSIGKYQQTVSEGVGNIVDDISEGFKDLTGSISENAKKAIDNVLNGKKEPVTFEASEESKENLKQDVEDAVKDGVSAGLAKGMGGRAKVESIGGIESQGADPLAQLTGNLVSPEDLRERLGGLTEEFLRFNDDLNTVIAGNISRTLSNLGTNIGQAIAQGESVVGAIGDTLIQGFAGFLSELGDLLIQYGAFAKIKGALDTAIKTGGFVAIAAGAAAIAVGVALKGVAGAIGSKASGGFSGSTGASASNDTGGRTTVSATTTNREIILRARGRDLVAVLNNENAFSNIIG